VISEHVYSPNKAARQTDYIQQSNTVKNEQQSNSDIVLKGLPDTFGSLSRGQKQSPKYTIIILILAPFPKYSLGQVQNRYI